MLAAKGRPADALQIVKAQGGSSRLRAMLESKTIADGILLDATEIAAESDLVTTEVVREATLRMDDNPTAGSVQIISLWQNSNASRALIWGSAITINWSRSHQRNDDRMIRASIILAAMSGGSDPKNSAKTL